MEADHTFPLPETETSKLEEVTQQLQRPQPEGANAYLNWVRSNRWPCILTGLILGFFVGKSLPTSRHRRSFFRR
jgi:hypothetical protein